MYYKISLISRYAELPKSIYILNGKEVLDTAYVSFTGIFDKQKCVTGGTGLYWCRWL